MAPKKSNESARTTKGSDKRFSNKQPNPAVKKSVASKAKPATVKYMALPKFADDFKLKDHLYLPPGSIVEASALKDGIEKAKGHIRSVIDEFAAVVMTDGHKISEIELSVSFDTKGSFLGFGFGVGGATSIKIKIVPSSL
jgi:hypothetical protein